MKSIWFFPLILTIILVGLSTLQLSGSSIGVYHQLFYGTEKDNELLLNKPQQIRSDEWGVTSLKTIAQSNNNYEVMNRHVGMGENTTLLADMPNRDWSIIFKPHDIGFLVLPFDNAFALRWWAMSYLLVLSVYFFVCTLLPNKRLLAVLLSLAFLCSPFLQWWYTYGAFASIYYILFGATAFIKMFHSTSRLAEALWACLIAYLAVAFALVLYPPFQIPCALVLAIFLIGYLLDHRVDSEIESLKRKAILLISAVVTA
jgi:hypothetical protein